MQAKKTVIISVSLLLTAALAVVLVFSTEPKPKREAATKRTAMLVEVIAADEGDFRPVIIAMGTVKPAQEVIIRPRVSGQVISRSTNFVPGGFVSEGEVLLQIDPADYQNLLAQRKSELTQVETALMIEMGEQELARRDFQRLNQNLSTMQKSLVLREPQLSAMQAKVEAAKAAYKQAELELGRTKLKAPFDAQILETNADVGSQISQNDSVAHLIGQKNYWIEATVPANKLAMLKVSDKPNVKILNRTAWQKGDYREGRLYSLIGELQNETRMARVLIEVEDPLALQDATDNAPALVVGSFVECQIPSERLNDVVKLPRAYLRKQNTAWVMQDEKLSIRELDIVFQDEEYVYVSAGLRGDEFVVTTSLSRIRDGADLRLK